MDGGGDEEERVQGLAAREEGSASETADSATCEASTRRSGRGCGRRLWLPKGGRATSSEARRASQSAMQRAAEKAPFQPHALEIRRREM